VIQYVSFQIISYRFASRYPGRVPKLWDHTIEAHREGVRQAIMGATLGLVHTQGLQAVTMSQVAAASGIGRATLYRYFADIEGILLAWHEQLIESHLSELTAIRDQSEAGLDRLRKVMETYARISHEHHGSELAALLHQGAHVARARQLLSSFVRDLLSEGAGAGEVRRDVSPAELASYCLHALGAAPTMPSKAAVRRLVEVVMSGLVRSAEGLPARGRLR
jgi:AcrR family transcriptional regulator